MTIALVALIALLVVQACERTLNERSHRAERVRLTSYVVARHAGEAAALASIDIKPKSKNGKPERAPDEDEMIGLPGN